MVRTGHSPPGYDGPRGRSAPRLPPSSTMQKPELHRELLEMRAEDQRVRKELMDAGELGGAYVPRMEAVHVRNAQRLRELIQQHGWPDEEAAGKDGAEAAWFIVQHAVGDPALQRDSLRLLRAAAEQGRVPRWHVAYLEDRVAMHEGRPQRYGTQWMDDPVDGRVRPWTLADPEQVNTLRAEMGMQPMFPIPVPGPELPPHEQQAIRDTQRWWEDWLAGKGWRS
jgi:hypothetical protein